MEVNISAESQKLGEKPTKRLSGPLLNYEKIKLACLKSLRGPLSQAKLSTILGYDYNQVNRWENGTKKLLWNELVDIITKLDKKKDLLGSINKRLAISTKDSYTKDLLPRFFVSSDATGAAQTLGCSTAIYRRWLRGDGSPSVETIFRILHKHFGSLDLILKDLNINESKELKQLHTYMEKTRNIFSDIPIAACIYAYIGREEHLRFKGTSQEYLSSMTALKHEEINEILEHLENANLIFWDDVLNKYYSLDENEDSTKRVRMNHSLEKTLDLYKYWAELSKRRLERVQKEGSKPERKDFICAHSVTISTTTAEKIQKKLCDSYDEILKIIENDTAPRTHTKVIYMHTFEPEDC